MPQQELWFTAKLAVRAYAQDPTQENRDKVALAWSAIRAEKAAAVLNRLASRTPKASEAAAPDSYKGA